MYLFSVEFKLCSGIEKAEKVTVAARKFQINTPVVLSVLLKVSY
jgi:hypothetical protein